MVKYKKDGVQLELLANPGSIIPYREGKLGKDKVLLAEEIFNNASKLQKAKDSELKKVFGTDDKDACIEIMLQGGEFPLSKLEIVAKNNARKAEIIQYLHNYYHDPRGEVIIPHPITRIEAAFESMKYHVNPKLPLNIEIRAIVKKLPEILPVKPINPPHLLMDVVAAGGASGASGGGVGGIGPHGRKEESKKGRGGKNQGKGKGKNKQDHGLD